MRIRPAIEKQFLLDHRDLICPFHPCSARLGRRIPVSTQEGAVWKIELEPRYTPETNPAIPDGVYRRSKRDGYAGAPRARDVRRLSKVLKSIPPSHYASITVRPNLVRRLREVADATLLDEVIGTDWEDFAESDVRNQILGALKILSETRRRWRPKPTVRKTIVAVCYRCGGYVEIAAKRFEPSGPKGAYRRIADLVD